MIFTIFKTETGVIDSLLDAPDLETLGLNIEEGYEFLPGAYDPDLFFVADHEAHPYPPKPGHWAVFDLPTRSWTDPRTADDLAVELSERKLQAKARITKIRGQARLAYVTDIPGQEMLYVAKNEEAKAYLADPDPQEFDYPLIMSEVGVTAETGYEVAQIFTNLNAMWRQAAGSLDAACFRAEAAVEQAPDTATIDMIINELEAALFGVASQVPA